jgi:hypothetical protein
MGFMEFVVSGPFHVEPWKENHRLPDPNVLRDRRARGQCIDGLIGESLPAPFDGPTTKGGLGGGEGAVATQLERRSRGQDRRWGGTMPPCLSLSGLARRRQIEGIGSAYALIPRRMARV